MLNSLKYFLLAKSMKYLYHSLSKPDEFECWDFFIQFPLNSCFFTLNWLCYPAEIAHMERQGVCRTLYLHVAHVNVSFCLLVCVRIRTNWNVYNTYISSSNGSVYNLVLCISWDGWVLCVALLLLLMCSACYFSGSW